MDDPYKELREASYEELLEVVIHHYDQHAVVVHDRTWLIRLGFALACEGGWRHVAPDWLVEHRKFEAYLKSIGESARRMYDLD